MSQCPRCKGSGQIMGASFVGSRNEIPRTCHICYGKGYLDAPAHPEQPLPCPFCGREPQVRGEAGSLQCDDHTLALSPTEWNRRAEQPKESALSFVGTGPDDAECGTAEWRRDNPSQPSAAQELSHRESVPPEVNGVTVPAPTTSAALAEAWQAWRKSVLLPENEASTERCAFYAGAKAVAALRAHPPVEGPRRCENMWQCMANEARLRELGAPRVEQPQPFPEFFKGQASAVANAIRAVETRVAQLDKWADENAAKKDYSGACSQQRSAVDLHCAVAIIKEAVFPHYHKMPGFRWDAGDTCPGCTLDEYDASL